MGFGIQLAVAAVLAGCCAGWGVALSRLVRKRPVLAYHPRPPAAWGLIDLALAAGLLMLYQLAVIFLLRRGCGFDPTQGWENLTSQQVALTAFAEPLGNLAAMATALAVIGFRTGAGGRDFGLALRHAGRDLWLGFVAFAMLAPPVYGLQRLLVVWFPYRHPLISLLHQHAETGVQAAVFFSAVAAAPVVEEFFYRVLWQGWLQELLPRLERFPELVFGVDGAAVPAPGTRPSREPGVPAALTPPSPAAQGLAIVACSTLFAAMHLSQGPAPIPLFVLALGLGYVYVRRGRILPCIVVHGLLNACSLAMLLRELLP